MAWALWTDGEGLPRRRSQQFSDQPTGGGRGPLARAEAADEQPALTVDDVHRRRAEHAIRNGEARIAPEVRAELGRRGHQVNVLDDWSWVVGGGQGIMRDPESGALMGGADPRRDGYAIAI